MQKKTWALTLTLLTAAFISVGSGVQSAAVPDSVPRDPVAAEVRRLREAVERLGAVSMRSHVLVNRLAIQQQRVVRAQNAIDGATEAMEAAERKQERTEGMLVARSGKLGTTLEPRRSELEREVETLKAELAEGDRDLIRLRKRRAELEVDFRMEQRTYAEREAALDVLDREMQRTERPGR